MAELRGMKRLYELAKANLSSLLDRGDKALKDFTDEEIAEELKRREDKRKREEREKLTREREELEAKRRAAARRSYEAEQAAKARGSTAASAPPPRSSTAGRSSSSSRTTSAPPPRSSASSASSSSKKSEQRYTPPPKPGQIDPKRLRELYAKLEVPYNAPFDEVKSSFRRLMRKYHPDLHVGDPKKHKAATELSMALTSAYRELEAHLTKK